MLTLCYAAPPAGLGTRFSCFFVVRGDGEPGAEQLPALLGAIYWAIRGAAIIERPDSALPIVDAVLAGPSLTAPLFRHSGDVVVAGVGLMPMAWPAITKMPAYLLADRGCAAEACLGPGISAPLSLDPQSDDAAIFAQLALTLEGCGCQDALAQPVVAAIDRWLIGRDHNVASLVEEAGVSLRQVERIALDHHGASPRLLGAKYRTLKLSAEIAAGRLRIADAAQQGEFYDQSHMIRNFKRFVGVTPRQFVADRLEFTRATSRDREGFRADNKLAALG